MGALVAAYMVPVVVQATFFIALAVASRMGTAALAAHQIVAQLWLLTSYVTDGCSWYSIGQQALPSAA